MAAEIVQVSQVAQRSVGEGVGRGVGVVGCVGQGVFFQNGLMQTRSGLMSNLFLLTSFGLPCKLSWCFLLL